MNNSQLKKSISLFANGHTIQMIENVVEVEKLKILKEFEKLEIKDVASAYKALKKIQDEEEKNKFTNTGRSKLGGLPVEDFKPEPAPYAGNFNKERAEKNFVSTESLIPLELQQEFRRDFRMNDWKLFAKTWTEKLSLSEKDLKEQVKLVSPSLYQERFKR